MRGRSILFGGILSLALPVAMFACAGGQEFTADSGMYTVDVTNDTLVIDPGMTVHFDFGLYNKSDPNYGPQDDIDFSDVDVQIKHGTTVLFSKKVPMSQWRELTGIDYPFPKERASDTITVEYHKDGKTIAQAAFGLPVGGGDPLFSTGVGVAVAVLAVLLVVTGVLYLRSRSV